MNLTAIGLFLDIIGVIILTIGSYNDLNLYIKRHEKGASLGISDEDKKKYKNSKISIIIALIIIVIGFFLQLIGSLNLNFEVITALLAKFKSYLF